MAATKTKTVMVEVDPEESGVAGMPTSLRIGPFTYSVRYMDKVESLTTNHAGFCDKQNLEIAVAEDAPPQRQAEVLLHEVMHACFATGDLNDGEPDFAEEKIVTVLTHQLLQVVRDNPAFVDWMSRSYLAKVL